MTTALILAVGVLGIGIANGQTTGNTYTACLKGGSLTKVAIGTDPSNPCKGSEVEISWDETGPEGPPGPSDLDALQGTDCTVGGAGGEVNVQTDPSTGVITLTCVPNQMGNGIMDPGEQCDDANTTNGDGCSSTGQIEPGFTCAGEPSDCAPAAQVMGNGTVEPPEQCDDGDTTNGDGCTSTGQVEPGFTCSAGSPSVCGPVPPNMGNGIIDPGEECDDGNNLSGDGCNGFGQVEPPFVCVGEPSICDLVLPP
jgi:cysteine-rich repeat protein